MDWNRVEGNWKQMKGKVKEKWGDLTDDDLTAINGQRDQLEGKIQERYGYEKDRVSKEVADWYDRQTTHTRNYEGQIDTTNGRIYRLRAKDAATAAPVDLRKLSTAELVARLESPNRQHRQMALRLIGDRKDASIVPALRQQLFAAIGQSALESLWALNLSGGLDE